MRGSFRFSLAVRRRSTALIFLLLLVAGRHLDGAFALGSATAVDWFGIITLLDPLAAVENIIATRALHLEVVIGGGILIAGAALLLGRAFCAWLCPLGLLLDLNDSLRRRLQDRRNLPLGQRQLKYWVLLFFLLLTTFSALPIFQTISPINYVVWLAVFAFDSGVNAAMLGSLPLLALMAAEWFSPRIWCRSLCPLGAFYSIVGGFARWRIRISTTLADNKRMCGRCTLVCSMGVKVMEEYVGQDQLTISDAECTRCGDCVDVCPRHCLSEGISMSV